jgi:hypothetical protein
MEKYYCSYAYTYTYTYTYMFHIYLSIYLMSGNEWNILRPLVSLKIYAV